MRRRAPRKVSQTTRGLAPGTRCPRLGTASHTWIPMVCCRRGCASVSASHSHVWLRSRSHGWLRVWPLEGIVNRDKRRLVFLCRSLLVWQAAWAASACNCLIVHLHLRVHLHLHHLGFHPPCHSGFQKDLRHFSPAGPLHAAAAADAWTENSPAQACIARHKSESEDPALRPGLQT